MLHPDKMLEIEILFRLLHVCRITLSKARKDMLKHLSAAKGSRLRFEKHVVKRSWRPDPPNSADSLESLRSLVRETKLRRDLAWQSNGIVNARLRLTAAQSACLWLKRRLLLVPGGHHAYYLETIKSSPCLFMAWLYTRPNKPITLVSRICKDDLAELSTNEASSAGAVLSQAIGFELGRIKEIYKASDKAGISPAVAAAAYIRHLDVLNELDTEVEADNGLYR